MNNHQTNGVMNQNGTKSKHARLLAFYLPQFHPIPENDAWWGKGFTEWSNVTKARPLFPGHYQPHLPANLGFYDLRLPETREKQANLATQYGIEGFCYWHYWFGGSRLLERPFNEVLRLGKPDYPFCLAWANESWSKRWLGEDQEILQKQAYSFEDDVNHIRWLMNAFADRRYLRVNNRPVFAIYRPGDLPEPKKTMDIFRGECTKNGLPEPFLLGINSFCFRTDCRTMGCDGTINFEPQLGVLPGIRDEGLKIYDYNLARQRMLSERKDYPVYPSVMVNWDNTPRRGQEGIVFINGAPAHFETGLRSMIHYVQERPEEERLVFINAWNEWAEGNHLEPDTKHGLKYLEAVQRANEMAESPGE